MIMNTTKNPSCRNLFTVFVVYAGLFICQAAIAEVSPNGVDFWENDRLHLPDYGACGNLILNPSFEAGLKYWGYMCYAQNTVALQYTDFHQIDNTVARTGSKSLRLRAMPFRDPLMIGTFTLPLVPQANYTLSFYAKGSLPTSLNLNVAALSRAGSLFDVSVVGFSVNEQWQRFNISFTATELFSSIYFYGQISASGSEGAVWLDDVQLEQGAMTDFTSAPASVALTSAARGNFLEFGQSPNFNLMIHSAANASGNVSLTVEDFFFKTVFEGSYPFTTDASGSGEISLDALSGYILSQGLRGVFIVKGVFNIEGLSRPYTDYFRFSVMDFLTNTHRNKDIFNLTYVYSLQSAGSEMDRFLARERAIGFGSINYDFEKFANDLDYGLDSERMNKLAEYGFGYMGRPVLKLHDGVGGEISELNGALKMINIKTMINPTSMQLLDFEYICEIKARNRPWNNIWWFTGESNPGCHPLETYPVSFAKFLRATYRGIKRGNPDAKVLIEGGPWNLSPTLGTLWVERYIQDTKALDPSIEFDGAAAHHYRNFPENPDLDYDIAAFLAMLDRNGCQDWPFYINEGGNYCPFDIPEADISPYIVHSANWWYTGPLSYHSGRAERIAAAFSARNWLIALKYQDRVVCMNDFMSPSRYTDADFTSRFYEKIPNTLGRILGSAYYDRDIQLPANCRGYLFKQDSTNQPIAAIWSYKESVDRWQENPPAYRFNFSGQNVQFIDLMENEVEFPVDCQGRTIIEITPFPLFIKGQIGSEQQLCDTLSQFEHGTGTTYIVMDGAYNNGSFAGASAGFWYNTPTAIPAGWQETSQYMYTTASGWLQCGSTAEAVNNTGEIVKAGHSYTVRADLGGGTGTDATVRVYATENQNGTGSKVLLAVVNRPGLSTDGYNLFTVTSAPGEPAAEALAGYYVQVVIGGPYSYANHYLSGNYDNIVVTSKFANDPICGDAGHPYPPGDINADCFVDTEDLFELGSQWLSDDCSQPLWCGRADVNQGGDVNLSDLAVIADNWTQCTSPLPPCCYNP